MNTAYTLPPLATRALRAADALTDATADVVTHPDRSALTATLTSAAATLRAAAYAYGTLAERVGYTAHAVTPPLVALAVARSLAHDNADHRVDADAGDAAVSAAVTLAALTDAAEVTVDGVRRWWHAAAQAAEHARALTAAALTLRATVRT